MDKYGSKFTALIRGALAVLTIAAISLGINPAHGAPSAGPQVITSPSGATFTPMRRTTAAQRKAAAAQAAAARKGAVVGVLAKPLAVPTPGGTPDYFGTTPNFANTQFPTLDPATGAITGGIRKFVDTLPGLGPANANGLGQYIPIANPDTITYPGSDYYEIGLVEYTERMHPDLPVTGVKLRGYVQLNNGTDPVTRQNTVVPAPVHYMGPIIIADSGRPVRVKFTNMLPTGAGGALFIPVDTTAMGAGTGPLSPTELYTQNRATIHLHGGATPWISDGTPHQWITPATETTSYPKGVSVRNVPDMPDPGPGSMTLFYTNQQSARLMFYHDHAYGITRLNVYAGEAAGYLLKDTAETGLINNGVIPGNGAGVYTYGIPLVIQDKTFVPDAPQLAAEDPTWNWAGTGNLWFPHVYMTNQHPTDLSGANAMGRYDYGPWFWPVFNMLAHGTVPNPYYDPAVANGEPPEIPGTPNPSLVPEGFMDTPVVNGALYPVLKLSRKPYRFRILNACNDRFLNLQLYYVDPVGATVVNGGSGYSATPVVTFSGGGATTQATGTATVTNVVNAIAVTGGGAGYTSLPTVNITGGGGFNATATAILTGGVVTGVAVTNGGSGYTSAPLVTFSGGGATTQATASATITGVVTGIVVTNAGSGYTSAPAVTITDTTGTGAVALASPNTEVKMVPAVATSSYPANWPTDGRAGGVPDPTTVGPNMVQIGTEGGFLPAPVELPNQPVSYNYNRRDIVVLNVANKTLFMGPAERADVIVDFSGVPDGAKLILYNDAPAPVPAFDTRFDYYTGDPDQTDTGGAPTTLPGYGPNTRTIMRFEVSGATPSAPFDMAALQAAFASTATTPGVFASSQDAPIVPQAAYGPAYNATYTDTFSRIQDTSLTYTPAGAAAPITVQMGSKAIQELFELDYGRMNATLGVELPFTNARNQTTIPLGYIDPPTETMKDGDVQIWKITHNGVDTHAIHFHLFNVQLINRVGWDGAIRPPEPNELGWKETVKMNPLEDAIVAIRPVAPALPFQIPFSVRPLDVTRPLGSTMGFAGIDPTTGNPVTVTNVLTNFGWEYVWHCHLLGHEENDMMRPIVFVPVPPVPVSVTPSSGNAQTGVTQTYTAVYSDVHGATNIKKAHLLINAGNTGLSGAYVYYDRAANRLYLMNDANNSWGAGSVLGAGGVTLTNSQCSVNCATSGAVVSGNTVTLTLKITFTPAFVGAKNIYMCASNNSGLYSVWATLGSVNVQLPAAPTTVSVSPASGNAQTGVTQTYTAVYSDANGGTDIKRVYLDINATNTGLNAAYAYYDRTTNRVYLMNDANNSWGAGSVVGAGGVTLTNSQCSVDAAASGAVVSGNTVTLSLKITFTAAFAGAKNIFMYVSDIGGLTSGWAVKGKVNVQLPAAPVAVSVTPSSGVVTSGVEQTFSAVYSDANGAVDLKRVYMDINATNTGLNAAYVYYDRARNMLYLMNDANNSWGAGSALGVGGLTLTNTQCSVDSSTSIAVQSGNNLTLSLAFTFNPAFIGAKDIFMYATDIGGLTSGWATKGSIRVR